MPASYTCLHYHIIFSTKNRRPLISTDFQDRLYSYIGGIIAAERGTLLGAGGMPDHIHLLVSSHPQLSVSDLLRLVKTNSSKWVHETFTDDFGWQDGYAAFTVSRSNLEQVREYIARQAEHHKRVTLQEELLEFLKRHGVSFDERFLSI